VFSTIYKVVLIEFDSDFYISRKFNAKNWLKVAKRQVNLIPSPVSVEWLMQFKDFNKLKTLKHSPSIISGLFYCIDNPLESLEGLNIPISKLHCNNKEKLIRKTKLKILESL
jgi:hypothetical protein